MLIPLKSCSLVFVMIMINSMSVPICNRFYVRQVNSDNKPTFRGYPSLTSSRQASFNLEGRNLNCYNLSLVLKILYDGYLNLSSTIFRNSLLKCVLQLEIAKNALKSCILRVQGRSKLSTLMSLKSLSPALVMISSIWCISAPICNCFHDERANSSKITTFRRDTPL